MAQSAIEWSVPFTFVICGIALILAGRLGFPTARWGWALGPIAAGYALMLVKTTGHSAIKSLIEDMSILTGIYCLSAAMRARFHKTLTSRLDYIVFAIFLISAIYNLQAGQDVAHQALTLLTSCLVVLGGCLWTICAGRDKAFSVSDSLLICAFVFLCVVILANIVITLAGTYFMGEGAWRALSLSTAGKFSGIIGIVALSFAVICCASLDKINQLRIKSQTDPLTGLLNREGLDARFREKARFGDGDGSSAVILADIDHFKTINDRFGHAFGDKVIASFAQILRSGIGPSGYVARVGGEEFVALLEDTSLDRAIEKAEAIRVAFRTLDWHGLPSDIEFSASFGVSEIEFGSALSSALERADRLLYFAKESGRDRVMGISQGASEQGPGRSRKPALRLTGDAG